MSAHPTPGRRPGTRSVAVTGALTLALNLGVGSLPAAAETAISSPPVDPFNVVVFPERDFVVAEGFTAGDTLSFRVLRDGVTIGTATAVAAAGDPSAEVNHPGGVCWDGATPDLLRGDVVQVLTDTTAGSEIGQATATAHVTAEQAVIEGTTVVVRGMATDGAGGRLPLELMEQRIINPHLVDTSVGRRDIRAVSDGSGLGTLSYDTPTGTRWTARYTGLDATVRRLAVEGQTRIMAWQHFDGIDRRGLTIYEVGETGGPGFGGCPAAASWAVTGTSPASVNLETQDQPLTVTGTAHASDEVTVTLDDSDPSTPTLTAARALTGSGAQGWSVTFPVADVATLSEGTLTADATYAYRGGVIGGRSLTLLKDLGRPVAPVATPAGGTFAAPQAVTLTATEGDVVHLTVDGTAPTADDPAHTVPLRVTASQTLRAVAVDAAGNMSEPLVESYVIDGVVDPAPAPEPVPSPADPPATPRAVVEPPQAPRNVVVFPERDFMVAEGFAAGQRLTVRVVRDGVVVGTANGTAQAGDPSLEVNHPGGVCWEGTTADLRPGDRVEVLTDTTPGSEQGVATLTQHVQVEPAVIEGDRLVVRGVASDGAGGRVPLDLVEQRIINPDFGDTVVGRRDLRAVADGSGDGTLAYDGPGTAAFTAAYDGLPLDVMQLAVAGQTRVLAWQLFDGVERRGITIYEAGEVGGPGLGGCAPAADHAVTSTTPRSVGIVTAGDGLAAAGVTSGASAVQVTVADGTPGDEVTVPATLAVSGETWTATFTAAQVAPLDEGVLSVAMTATVGGTQVPGVPLQVLKDVTAPLAPTVTPAGARYLAVQAVTLSNPLEKSLAIHYTSDNSRPHADDPRYAGQLDVAADVTLRAVAVDAAGNTSAEAVQVYVIGVAPPAVPTLALAPSSDSGAVDDGLTNDATPTFTGTAPDGTVVSLRANGVEVATAAVTSGTWSATSPARPDGPTTWTAVATDNGGRSSAPSAELVVTIDSVAPGASLTSQPPRTDSTPTFTFAAPEPAGFACSMSTGAAAYQPCTSPHTYSVLPDGTYSFAVRATDSAGNTGTAATLRYVLDATAPTVTAPVATLPLAQLGTTDVPVQVSWSGSDGTSGVSQYELRRSTDGAAPVVVLTTTATSTTTSLAPGRTYRFSVVARDGAGNTTTATGPAVVLTAAQETATSVTYPWGSWTQATQTGSYGGAVKHAGARGAVSRVTFTGSSIAWVSTLANNRGQAEVWLDSQRVATIDLFSSATRTRQVVFSRSSLDPTVSHSLEVRVLGTKLGKSKGTRVDVDAFVSLPPG